jgi:MFS superfamily sulfate permease-like transporter
MKCGWDVLDWPYIRRLHQLPNTSVIVMVRNAIHCALLSECQAQQSSRQRAEFNFFLSSSQALVLLLTVFVDLIVAVAVGCAVMSVLYVKDTAAVQLSHCSLLTSASDRASAPLGELTSEEARLLSRSSGRLGFFMLEVQALLMWGVSRHAEPAIQAPSYIM